MLFVRGYPETRNPFLRRDEDLRVLVLRVLLCVACVTPSVSDGVGEFEAQWHAGLICAGSRGRGRPEQLDMHRSRTQHPNNQQSQLDELSASPTSKPKDFALVFGAGVRHVAPRQPKQ